MNGQLEQIGDRWRLRFTRDLKHPPERVWRAIVDPADRAAWFPDRCVGEFEVGATLRFESEHVEGGSFEGRVLAADPPKALEFTWGTDLIRIELEPTASGCTLTLLDTIDQLGKAARDGAGWHVCVDKLELSLDGASPSWADGDRWRALHHGTKGGSDGGYVAAFGPEASTIGPPETWQG